MATTPKPVRRNGGSCTCPDIAQRVRARDYAEGTCKYGNCFTSSCLVCGGVLFSTAPVACRCGNPPRWVRHRGMMPLGYWRFEADGSSRFMPGKAAVKPDKHRKRRIS